MSESPLVKFCRAGFEESRRVIGGEDLSIDGGPVLSAVLDELEDGREYEVGGQERMSRLSAVVPTKEWDEGYAGEVGTYLGRLASTRGRELRVERVSRGAAFVRLEMVNAEEGV